MLRYTLSFGNRSAQLQMDGTLTMPVPVGTTLESASGGGIETSGSVVWALGNLALGDSGLRDVVVRINDTVREGQTVTAAATLTAGSALAEAQAITHVQTAAALTARIDVGPDPVVPGETLLVSLTVTNRGPVDLFSVMAAVRMPAEIAAFGAGFASDGPACFGGICDFPERVIWTSLGTLAAGQGITVTMPATVNSGASAPPNGALIVFDGDAIANDGSETRARRSVRVRASRALELEMDVDPQPVLVGEDLHYRLTFGNRGTGLLQATQLEMAVPAGTTFQSASDDGVETSGTVR